MTAYKQPDEKIPLAMDFINVLPIGETLQSSSDVKVYDGNGTDVSGTMLFFKTVVGSKVNAIIQNGADLGDYKITFIGITQNYQFEEDITLKVREQ
jgi:phage-related protein